MSAEEVRSEHVMIRLKPSEKALLDAKARERGLKPTQLAYEALLGALSAKYTPEEVSATLDEHKGQISKAYEIIRELERRTPLKKMRGTIFGLSPLKPEE